MNQKLKTKQANFLAFKHGSEGYVSDDNTVKRARTTEWDLADKVWLIEDAVTKIFATTNILFTDKRPKGNGLGINPLPLGKTVLRALKTDFGALRTHYPMHTFNPYVEEFIRQASACDVINLAWEEGTLRGEAVTAAVTALNAFVGSLRKIGTTPEFKKIIADFIRKANKNYCGLSELIHAHFEERSRMLVIRLDVGYEKNKEWPAPGEVDVTYEQTKAHRIALLPYLQKAVPKGSFVASACKLEYGLDKKWHYHCLLLLDGSMVREDVTIARMIGEHWKNNITEGKGLYWNCNANKGAYKSCGIGMISHADVLALEGLDKAVTYMTKVDYYVKLLVPDGDRTFWKTNMPKAKPNAPKKGRPRTKRNEPPKD